MIDNADLGAARERLSDADAALFDRVLTAAQGYEPATRAAVEYLLTVVGMHPPGQPFDAVMLPHDTAFDQQDIGDKRSLCGVLRERVLERLGVAWPLLTMPFARRPPQPSRLPAIAAECDFAKKRGAYFDVTTWVPGNDGPELLDGLFVGAPYTGCPGIWSTGGEYGGAHARTPVLVEGNEIVCISGGGPGNHFERLELVVTGRELWTARYGAGVGADGRPRVGRRVWGITRTASYPRVADTEPAPPPDA